jgi:hypothetical protein
MSGNDERQDIRKIERIPYTHRTSLADDFVEAHAEIRHHARIEKLKEILCLFIATLANFTFTIMATLLQPIPIAFYGGVVTFFEGCFWLVILLPTVDDYRKGHYY